MKKNNKSILQWRLGQDLINELGILDPPVVVLIELLKQLVDISPRSKDSIVLEDFPELFL